MLCILFLFVEPAQESAECNRCCLDAKKVQKFVCLIKTSYRNNGHNREDEEQFVHNRFHIAIVRAQSCQDFKCVKR